VSPSLMNGLMLLPHAQKRQVPPFPSTARISSILCAREKSITPRCTSREYDVAGLSSAIGSQSRNRTPSVKPARASPLDSPARET